MTKAQADRFFIEECYGSNVAFRNAVHSDWIKAELIWTCYVDGLHRNGEITERQRCAWTFPGNRYKKIRYWRGGDL